ncbi:MAG: sensor histidine kinase, partial [Bacteroidota bacterium]
QFNVEQTKREAAQLQLKNETQEKELVESRLRQTFAFGGLGLVGLMGAFFFISQQRERKQKELVAAKNEQLNTLIKDHHHRFKNQYQFLTGLMDIESAEGRLSREVAKSYQNRMKAMRDMEDLLSMRDFQDDPSSEVEVQPLFERYRNFFLSANRKPEQMLDFRYELPENFTLPLDEAGNILLIMSELATNSIKHNKQIHELILEVDVEHLGKKEYRFKMRDNGRGWPKTPTGKLSLGTDIVEILVDNLESSQKKTYNDNGAVVDITFTLKKKKRG